MTRFAVVGLVAALMAGCVRVEYPAPSGTTQALPMASSQLPYAQPASYETPSFADPRVIPATQVVTQPIVRERVVYQRAPVHRVVSKPKRSVAKSALIIGGSAAGGAGIGALVGGKKGAGIGALAGGGAAALWDQITRHKQ